MAHGEHEEERAAWRHEAAEFQQRLQGEHQRQLQYIYDQALEHLREQREALQADANGQLLALRRRVEEHDAQTTVDLQKALNNAASQANGLAAARAERDSVEAQRAQAQEYADKTKESLALASADLERERAQNAQAQAQASQCIADVQQAQQQIAVSQKFEVQYRQKLHDAGLRRR